ncbi:hypothetical protein Tco_1177911 [Tanacetum coccineum]
MLLVSRSIQPAISLSSTRRTTTTPPHHSRTPTPPPSSYHHHHHPVTPPPPKPPRQSPPPKVGRNTRDLGSFGEEMDKTTDLHQHLSRISSQRLEMALQIQRDAVTTKTKTASQDFMTASVNMTQPII